MNIRHWASSGQDSPPHSRHSSAGRSPRTLSHAPRACASSPASSAVAVPTSPAASSRRASSPCTAPPDHGRRGNAPLLILASLLLAVALWALLTHLPGSAKRPATAPAANAPAQPASNDAARVRHSVAVLPIADETGDAELERARIGRILSDAFVQALVDVRDVHVVSPLRLDGVARALGRSPEDAAADIAFARAVAAQAGASAMLSGSLGRVGNTYVLSIALTQLDSERLLSTFRAESQDRERLLEELTRPLSEALRQTLATAADDTRGVDRLATTSFDAYANFVRGADLVSEGDWAAAIPELEKAVAADPGMALAWSTLGCAYSFKGDEARSQAAQRQAEEHLDNANRKESWWIRLNGIWVSTGNGPTYHREALKFIEAFPDDREGHFYIGLGLEYLEGKCEDAIGWYEKARVLTPNFYPVIKSLVDCRLKLDRREEAIATLERYLELPHLPALSRQKAESRLAELGAAR